MRPFIIRYAKSITRNDIVRQQKKLEYNAKTQSNVVSGSFTWAINDPGVRVDYTGSLITKANTDPTSDEPTDR